MHGHALDNWQHDHVFLGAAHERNERRTWAVVGLTAAMTVVEIAGGTWFGSMALLADGWHMSTHAGALAIAAFAYRYARRHAHDPRFAFGTSKLGDLAGFASAIVLAVIALGLGVESVLRFFQPVAIHYPEATAIAVVGLLGAIVIAQWSWRLIRDAGAVLLDAAPDTALVQAIRGRLEQGHDSIADLHVWRLGPGHHGAIVSLVVDQPQPVETYKARLAGIAGLSHVTVEVHQCHGAH
jgi:Co/Zn/Cd efflux system component